MTDFGFPVGPLALLDEVGIDVGAKVAKVLHHAFGERMAPPAVDGPRDRGRPARPQERPRLLRATNGKKKRVDASVYALLPSGAARSGSSRARSRSGWCSRS